MSQSLARLLADGRFHSGQDLGRYLGVGRAAVWKQVQALILRGVEIEAVRGRGYRISGGLDLLDVTAIKAGLSPLAEKTFLDFDARDLVDSTNAVALRRLQSTGAGAGYVCVAEQQEAGRGRRGRTWISPYAKNIYTSLIWKFDGGLPAIQGLSIAVGVAVCEALESLGCDGVSLKWPNDVFYKGAKLAGTLVEVVGDMGGECAVVVGIGVNVAMPKLAAAGIDQPWVDLSRAGCLNSRNEITSALLSSLARVLGIFEKNGVSGVVPEWDRLDLLRGRGVQLLIGMEVVEGVAAGIDHSGALLLDTPAGRRAYSSGEISVRGWQ